MNITEYIYSTDANERYDYESHVFENVWYEFVKHLPKKPDDVNNSIDVWYDEETDEILCLTEDLAEMIADIIEDISGEKMMVRTGYYDPEEDALETNGPFRTTGWYYVDYD